MQTHETPSLEERAAAIGDNVARLQQRMADIASEAGRDPQIRPPARSDEGRRARARYSRYSPRPDSFR